MIFGQVTFLAPAYLLLIPLMVVLALAWKKMHHSTDRSAGNVNLFSLHAEMRVRHPAMHLLQIRSQGNTQLAHLDRLVAFIVAICLAIALAEPVMQGSRIPERPAQRDITFIVDSSVSMLLKDYVVDGIRIDRMQFLKGYLDRFVQQLDSDRISVIVFGDQAYTYVPLTDDKQFTRRMISRIETTMAGRFNAVGEAIALGVRESGKDPEHPGILILFTDADSPTGSISPYTAAQLAKEAGLPLYTITIGALSYQASEKEKAGLVYHPADNQMLEQLAKITGAKNYLASDQQALSEAIAEIDLREKYTRESQPGYFQQPLYHYPLACSLLLIALYQFWQLSRTMRKPAEHA